MRTLSTCALVSCCSSLPHCSRSSRQIRSPPGSPTRLASSRALLAPARQAWLGSSYVVRLNGEGGCGPTGIPSPYQYRVLNGSLPRGLALDKDGLLHGTPAMAGTWSFWVELSDEDPPSAAWCRPVKSEREFILTVMLHQLLSDLPTRYRPAPAGSALGVVGRLRGASTRPCTESNHGSIVGTPAVTGTFAFKLSATDTRGVTATVDLTIQVYPQLALATTRLAPPGWGGHIVQRAGERQRAAPDFPRSLWPSADRDTSQHEDRCARAASRASRASIGSRSRRRTACVEEETGLRPHGASCAVVALVLTIPGGISEVRLLPGKNGNSVGQYGQCGRP